jgi:hypothetical protein
MFMVGDEEDAVIADAPTENALPFVAVERFDIALEGVGCHLVENTSHAFLNGLREVFKILLGVGGELQSQFMFDLAPGFCLPLAGLFHRRVELFCLGGRKHIVWTNDPSWFDEHAIALLAERHEVALPEVYGLEQFARNDHLAALADPADPVASWGRGLIAILSDYLNVRNCHGR